jgi:DNA modification methylase
LRRNSEIKLESIKTTLITGELPLNIPVNSYLNVKREKANPIHELGNPHSAKFIPEIPRWAIKKYSKEGDTILDPFVGSGTTLVEALFLGRSGLGIDHNPLARLISKVKTTPINETKLITTQKRLINSLSTHATTDDSKIPDFRNRDFWFDHSASQAISMIRNKIMDVEDKDMRDFFTVVLSEIIQKVSKVASGQILPAARKKQHEKPKVTREEVFLQFIKQLERDSTTIRELHKINSKYSTKIIGDDAREISLRGKINAIVTSPPYINAHHYIWTHKLRLLQLVLVNDKSRLDLMKKEIGTEELSKEIYNSPQSFGIDELDEKILQIYDATFYKATGKQNALRSASTYQYFVDMEKHFMQAYRLLDSGSKYCLVIGDNSICKVFIPTAKYLTMIAERMGFHKIFNFQVVLKNRTLNIPRNVNWSSSIHSDQIIIFEKN